MGIEKDAVGNNLAKVPRFAFGLLSGFLLITLICALQAIENYYEYFIRS